MFTKSNRTRIAMVVAVAFGLMTFAMPAQAVAPPIYVVKSAVSGGIVQVTVKNTTSSPVTGTVAVQAILGDTAVWSLVPVVLLGGQCATVSAAFTSAVKSVSTVSITDDAPPI
jgi:hypothetical protein